MNYELFCTFAFVMKPLISFIITYHNEPEAFLRACLESIQALPLAEGEAEIIVVDDGSSSQLRIKKKELKIIRQAESGLSVARNTGLEASQGLYIQFVDADDQLIPSAYKWVLEELRKETSDLILFKMSTKEWECDKKPVLRKSSGPDFLLNHNLRAAAWGYAFRREILGDLRFYPGLLHEDELFTPQLFLRVKTLVELNVKAYFYRQYEGTITSSKSFEKTQKRLNDTHFILRELNAANEPLLERRIRQLTVDYLQKTLTLTHSLKEVRRRIKELRKEGFLPLPVRLYSLRYFLASLVV